MTEETSNFEEPQQEESQQREPATDPYQYPPPAVSAQDVLDSLAENVCVVDSEGRIVAVNAAWREFAEENNYRNAHEETTHGLGTNYLEICRRAFDIHNVEAAGEIAEGLRQVINREIDRYTKEYPCHAPNEKRWFMVTISPLRFDHGGAVITHVNITESYQMREELRRSETRVRSLNQELEERVAARTRDLQLAFEELESFSYTVSHDLRTPFRSISGYVSILLEDFGKDLGDEGQGYIRRIQTIIANSSKLIDALVELAGMSREELHLEEVDLREIASTILEQLRSEHPSRNINVSLTGELTARCDRRMIAIVLENLLQNAWKFTQKTDQAEIHITGCKEDGSLSVTVNDNGIGFDNAEKELLFKPFQRLVSSDQFTGHGIGLATVDRIIRRHGGSVEAEGSPGKGATFSFRIPVS